MRALFQKPVAPSCSSVPTGAVAVFARVAFAGGDLLRASRAPCLLAALTLALAALPAAAKDWNGVEAGRTTKAQIVEKFGQPSRVIPTEASETLAYFQKQAPAGTNQVQFKIDRKTGLVERFDLFPKPVIEQATIENNFGPPCSAKIAKTACYVRKLTDDFRTYFHYPRLGLAVFFNEDGETVHSFIYQVPRSPKSK